METWHRLGTREELLAQVPFAIKLDRHRIALFHYDGALRAIADGCNHRGGPLSEGRLRDEFVMCPWHGWEYSVITGRGPEGFDEEQVPVFAIEERADGVYVRTPPVMPRKLVKHKPSHLLEDAPQAARRSAPGPRPLHDGDGCGQPAVQHQRRAAGARARAAPSPAAPRLGCCGSATSSSGPAKATTRKRAEPAPGPAPSPSGIPPIS